MVKTLAQKVKQVERLEPLEPQEVKPKTRKVYLVITLAYEYEPKPSKRKFLNK